MEKAGMYSFAADVYALGMVCNWTLLERTIHEFLLPSLQTILVCSALIDISP